MQPLENQKHDCPLLQRSVPLVQRQLYGSMVPVIGCFPPLLHTAVTEEVVINHSPRSGLSVDGVACQRHHHGTVGVDPHKQHEAHGEQPQQPQRHGLGFQRLLKPLQNGETTHQKVLYGSMRKPVGY